MRKIMIDLVGEINEKIRMIDNLKWFRNNTTVYIKTDDKIKFIYELQTNRLVIKLKESYCKKLRKKTKETDKKLVEKKIVTASKRALNMNFSKIDLSNFWI